MKLQASTSDNPSSDVIIITFLNDQDPIDTKGIGFHAA